MCTLNAIKVSWDQMHKSVVMAYICYCSSHKNIVWLRI